MIKEILTITREVVLHIMRTLYELRYVLLTVFVWVIIISLITMFFNKENKKEEEHD